MTQTPDGRWLSLGNNEIFANKKFLGMAYQSYLAREVLKLGYEIEPLKHGQFDIKGFLEKDLETFSKRRQQIIALAGANSSWAEREKIWDDTRQRKQKLPESELVAFWKEEAAALGIRFVRPGENWQDIPANEKSLAEVLDLALAHCSERNVAFRQEDLEKFILESRLAYDVTAIAPLIREHQELIALPGLTDQFTTMTAVRRELATIELMQQGQCQVIPISQREVVESHLENTLLNAGQRQAVELAATTSDQFIAWQGVAGAGKTFALKELKAIAFNAGYIIKGFAPSSSAAKVLSEELEIQSLTIARLLVTEPQEIEPNQIWIVDEASLLSAKDAHALLQRATLLQARVILVGDTRQLSAVSAGNPFKSLQQAGIKTAHLNESLRQKNPQLKLAVDLIADGRIEAGFERLEANGSILSIDSFSKIEQIANDYIVGTPEQRAKTLVLAGTNTERLFITQAIRSKLKGEGTLGETATITQLQTKNLSTVQMRFAHNFEIGDVVMPTRDYKRRGLEKDKLYEVVGRTTDKLNLRSDDGNYLEVDTAFEKAVYQRAEIEIAVGDRLQWKKNDRQLGRRNGQEFTVTGIDLNIVQIKYADERTECISLAQAQNLDYALVSTTYSSQGKTADRVLISADFTIGQESFYVAASRARHELKIYTEDPTRLLWLAQQSKAKENALELLRKQVHSSREQQRQLSQQLAITINISDELVAPVLKSDPVLKTQTVVNPQVLKTPFSPEEPETKPICQKEVTTEIPVVKLKEIELPPTVTKPHIDKPVPKPAVPTEAFWTPHHTEKIPHFIEPKDWQEFENSAIHPDITALNFESLQFNYAGGEHEAWERLMISDRLKRTNTGRLTEGFIKAYSHLDAGGWWCDAGVDPRSFADLTPGDKPPIKRWGCYKPNTPRPKKDDDGQIIEGKFIKYEHPPKVELSIFLLDVPQEIAERIYKKAGVEPSNSDRQSGFWYCVWKHNIPTAIAEGAKKAASLLSQGHAAIGLPGISAGYRTPKDEFGKKIGKSYLHEELAVFATPNRVFKFCFDYETKPETKLNIERDISVTGGLLQKAGAKVKVVSLPGPDKGVDDFIVARGPLAYEKLSHQAMNLRDWQRRNQYKSAATISPPQKLTKEQRSLQQNQSIGQTDDINRQQSKTDTGISSVNRENREIVEQSRETESGIERKNPTFGTEPSRRNEEFLTAISQYVELQEVEQLGDDITRINLFFGGGQGTNQRTESISGDTDRKNSAILDQTTSYRSSERIVNAITNFVEQSSLEVALAETLQPLIQEFSHDQQDLTNGKITLDKLSSALAEQEKHQLSQLAVNAITDYVEQSSVESLEVNLPILIKELSQYQLSLTNGATTLDKLTTALIQSEQRQISQLAINAIVDYVDQSSVESALAETLPTVIKELSFYSANSEITKIVTNVVAVIDKLSECLKQKTAGAVEEKEQVTTNIKSLLKQMLQHLDKQQMLDLFIEVGKYAQGEKVKGEQVNKLFYPVAQTDLSLTFEQKMNLVRQLIREDKARIMNLLSIPQSHESKQNKFRR
jgi:ATP-dependent exoDNAse (exonuclease V) alpha subunit